LELPVISDCNLLLIGPDDDAVALLQTEPPRVVHLADAVLDIARSANKPMCWLADALLEPRVDRSKRVWWELDIAQIAQCMYSAQLTTEEPDTRPGQTK